MHRRNLRRLHSGWDKAEEEMKNKLGEGFFNNARRLKTSVVVATGIPRLDLALNGGLYCGVTEIFGGESVGKTLLLAHIIASAQRSGKKVVLGATESLDVPYLECAGADTCALAVIRSESPLALYSAILDFASNGDSVAVIDSLSAAQGEYGEYSDWYEAVSYLMANSRDIPVSSCIVATSQVRQRKSIKLGKLYGRGTSSASKNIAGDFVTRLEIVRGEVSEYEYTMTVIIREHINAAPGKVIDFNIVKGQPIDVGEDLLMLGLENGTVHQRGAFYYIGDHPLGQGKVKSGGVILSSQELTKKVLGV